jgi:hypothetical protein
MGGSALGGTAAPAVLPGGNVVPMPGLVSDGPMMASPSVTPKTAPNGAVSQIENMPGRPTMGGKGVVGGQPAQPITASQPTAMAQTSQPNVYNQSAQAYNQALQGTQAGMQYQPMMVGGQGYNPYSAASTGYNAATAGAQGYNAATAGSTGYGAAQANAAQLAGTDMSQYMNPFTQNVIDRSLADIGGAQQTAMGQLGAQAQAARAFGGSRQGIAQAETNKGFVKQMADTSANLNLQGYNQAQQAAFQDIAARNQMGLANQAALNQAGQFGAGAANQAAMANQAARNQAGQFGAGAVNQASLSNQAAFNQAGQFGAGAFNQAAMANQGAYNQAGQFGAGAANQAALANQQASLAAAQQRLGASSQMGGLANTGFNFGQQLGAQQGQQGALQQALNQALIDAGKSQYGGFTGAPNQALTLPLAALGVSNMGQKSTTDSKQLGLLDYLTAAGQIGSICWVAREVYGADDPKWLQFREYLLSKAPAWLLNAYIKHGEKFAEVVKRNSWIKAILRPLMDAGRRKVGYK